MPDILINLGSRYHLTWEYGAPLVDLVGNEVASDPRCCPLNVSGKTSLSNPVTKGKLRSYGCFMLFPPDSPFFEPLGATYWASQPPSSSTHVLDCGGFVQKARWFAVGEYFTGSSPTNAVLIDWHISPFCWEWSWVLTIWPLIDIPNLLLYI